MAHAGRLDSAAMTDSEPAALAASVVCVLAASDLDPSLIARAVRVARAFEVRLVLAVCASPAQASGPEATQWCRFVLREATAALGDCAESARVVLVIGAVDAAVERLAPLLSAILVVVSAPSVDGAMARALCVKTGRPVLVARPSRGETVLVATDLTRATLPVLRGGAAFAQRLGAPMVAVHNVESPLPVSSFEWAHAGIETIEAACRARLERAVEVAAPRARSVTCTMFDTAQALAERVRDEGADVLVVGARRRWFEGWRGAATSARVVDEASCSVLLVPLAPLEAEKGACSWS